MLSGGLLIPESVGTYGKVEFVAGDGLGALGGVDVCAGGAATVGTGITPVPLPFGAE